MLLKVIKSELKLTWVETLIICLTTIAFGVVSPLFLKMDVFFLSGLFVLVYWLLVLGSGVYTVIIIFRIFYKSMFENEGYLTNVLPISVFSLVIGKFLAAMILVFAFWLSLILSLNFFLLGLTGQFLVEYLYSLIDYLFSQTIAYVYLIYIFFSMLLSYACFFLSSAIYNTFKTRKFKVLIILAMWMIIASFAQKISTIASALYRDNIFYRQSTLIGFLIIDIVVTIGLIFLVLFGAIYIVDKKVDIE